MAKTAQLVRKLSSLHDPDLSIISSGEFTGMNHQVNGKMNAQLQTETKKENAETEIPGAKGLSIWNRVSAVLENPRQYFKLAVSKEEDLPQLKDLNNSLQAER